MQARNLRRVTDRALALIEARLAALMAANPPGRPPQPAGKPDGQPAGSDAAEPDRLQTAAPMPADPAGPPSQPVGKPDGQPAGSDAAESGRVQAATPMPADPAGPPSQPAGKPDGQPAGSDAAESGRVQAATPMPADPAGRPPQPAGKPDGQPAGFDAREPDRAQLPSARTMRDIRAAHPDPADKHALRERMDRLENRGARVSRRALIAEVRREQTEPTGRHRAAPPTPSATCRRYAPSGVPADPITTQTHHAVRSVQKRTNWPAPSARPRRCWTTSRRQPTANRSPTPPCQCRRQIATNSPTRRRSGPTSTGRTPPSAPDAPGRDQETPRPSRGRIKLPCARRQVFPLGRGRTRKPLSARRHRPRPDRLPGAHRAQETAPAAAAGPRRADAEKTSTAQRSTSWPRPSRSSTRRRRCTDR